MDMGLDSESRVADGAVTLDGDLSVAADEANREFDVFYERGLFASVGDARVLAGPFDVRLDYGAFRSAFHVASDLYWRKSGLVFVVLCWWLVPVFLFDLDSLRGESFGSKVAVFSFLAMLAIAVWFVLRPPSMLGLRDSKAARDFFCIHGADMEAWNPGPKKWYNDPADHSMSVRVQVRVTELGVEELAGDGSLIRIPFTQMRRWPSMMRGLMSFVAANKDSDSLHLSDGDDAYMYHRIWDGRGVFVPLSSLDRPWVLWRECYGRIREARRRARRSRRWKRLSRVVLFPRGVRDRWSDRSEALVVQDGCWELAADVFNLVRQHRDGDVSFLDELSGGKEFSSDSIGGVLRDLILVSGADGGAQMLPGANHRVSHASGQETYQGPKGK